MKNHAPITIAVNLLPLWQRQTGRLRILATLRELPPLTAAAVAVELYETLRHDTDDPSAATAFRRYIDNNAKGTTA